MRYGMNPHQAARVVSENNPLRTLNGEPSLINYLDALNSWQLVHAVKTSLGLPAAASFKHVSPAGVATPEPLDETMQETWGIGPKAGPVTSAYVRARDGDPKSSYGDVIALSDAVDLELALAALNPIDLVNWQIRYASGGLSATQRQEFARLFGFDPSSNEDRDWRNDWLSSLTGVTLGSDGFIPFKDNIDYAAEVGVDTAFAPGGSIRTGEVHELATELGMRHIQTNLRLFHH